MPEPHSMREVGPLLLVVACLGFFPTGWSQDGTAAITGNVADPTGASIVGVTITAKDKDRETTFTCKRTAPVFSKYNVCLSGHMS
jgi:hypothetical protein